MEAMPSKEDFDDAADELADAIVYLQTQLHAGEGVLESQWIGPVMRAHELLLQMSEVAPTNEQQKLPT